MVTLRLFLRFFRIGGWVGLLVVSFYVLEWAVALLPSAPPLVVSRETTRITEPLAADGLPDFVRAAVELGSAAIPAETNAAAAIWQVVRLDPTDAFVDHSLARLTAADQLPEGDRFNPHPDDPADLDRTAAGRIVTACTHIPWRADQYPWLARWLDDNSTPLGVIAAGAQREGWCPPRCLPADRAPDNRFGTDPLLIQLVLPVEGRLDAIGTALMTRAMAQLGDGDPAAAWRDLDILLRLGDKVTDTPGPLVARTVGQSLLTKTARAVGTLAGDGRLADASLVDVQRALRKALDWAPLSASLESERLMGLDAIIWQCADPSKPNSIGSWARLPFAIVAIDTGRLLADANRAIDQLVDIVSLPTRRERLRAWRSYADTIDARRRAPFPRRAWFQPWYEVLTEGINRAIFGLMLPGMEPSLQAEDRARAALVLADCAVALERFRLRHGRPPESLAELVPDFLPMLPLDPFTDLPPGYRCEDGRWTLWSGAAPEGGEEDDLVVRWPTAWSGDGPSTR